MHSKWALEDCPPSVAFSQPPFWSPYAGSRLWICSNPSLRQSPPAISSCSFRSSVTLALRRTQVMWSVLTSNPGYVSRYIFRSASPSCPCPVDCCASSCQPDTSSSRPPTSEHRRVPQHIWHDEEADVATANVDLVEM